jgi:hypothetical protein
MVPLHIIRDRSRQFALHSSIRRLRELMSVPHRARLPENQKNKRGNTQYYNNQPLWPFTIYQTIQK